MTILVIILHNSTLYNNGRNRERGQYLTCISTCIEMNDWGFNANSSNISAISWREQNFNN